MTLAPSLLVGLGRDRFALVVTEEDPDAAHADPGAIAVAYLRRAPDGWQLDRLWPEIAWTGNTGRPADAVTLLPFGRPRMVLVTRMNMIQGDAATTGWVISLGAGGPQCVGSVPVAGSDVEGGCDRCGRFAFAGVIKPPDRAGDVFSVDYAGWTAPANGSARKIPFHAHAGYYRTKTGLAPHAAVKFPHG